MCGIAGIIGIHDTTDAGARLQQMTKHMSHRGPDAGGHFVKPLAALGHRRLSIIDLSDAATQPMSDPSGRYTIIYNGEVYNYQEIKAELGDLAYQSKSDTDVILAAYIKWGAESLTKLNGMFAFAIWDEEDKSLFVARDRLGIKPLYFSEREGKLIFSSEIRSLLASGLVDKVLNREALSEYLRYYATNAPQTLLKDVEQLMAGSYGIWKNGRFSQHTYWQAATVEQEAAGQSYETVAARVRELLQEGVERRLMSDVPFGAFLSGGIDSSAIVALMATVSDQPVDTFSIIFEDEAFDESQWSSLIAKKYNTRHHPITLDPNDFLEKLPQALTAMDHPSGDGLNSYVVSEATKKEGFTVALSGLGGDELFAGYPVFQRYQRLRNMKSFYGVPSGLRSLAGQAVATVYRNHKTARLQELIELEQNRFEQLYPVFRKIYNDREIDRLLGMHTPAESTISGIFLPDELDAINELPIFSQVSIGEISTYTQNVLLKDTDQMSMAHALEVRVPFFDHKLVEYVLGIPDAIKQPTYPKKLLVESLGELLPHEIVHRKKMGFMFPWENWMRNELKDFCETHMYRLAEREVFAADEVFRIWQGFMQKNKEITWIKVWMLVVLDEWMERHGIR